MGMAPIHDKRQLEAYAVTWQATLDTDREWRPELTMDQAEKMIRELKHSAKMLGIEFVTAPKIFADAELLSGEL